MGILEIREEENDDPPPGGLPPIGPSDTVFGQIMTDNGGTVYLKQHSYGNYDGQSWCAALPYSQTLPGNLSYNYLTSIAIANYGGENYNTAQFKDLMLYMLPYYMDDGLDYERQNSDTIYTGTLQNFSVPYW